MNRISQNNFSLVIRGKNNCNKCTSHATVVWVPLRTRQYSEHINFNGEVSWHIRNHQLNKLKIEAGQAICVEKSTLAGSSEAAWDIISVDDSSTPVVEGATIWTIEKQGKESCYFQNETKVYVNKVNLTKLLSAYQRVS